MNYRNADRKNWSARAKQEGQRAMLRGASITTCPYAIGGVLARAWREGYETDGNEAAHCPSMLDEARGVRPVLPSVVDDRFSAALVAGRAS